MTNSEKQLNRIEAKIGQLSELVQKTLTATVQANPYGSDIEHFIKQQQPQQSSEFNFSPQERLQMDQVIKLQKDKGFNTKYLEDLLTYNSLTENQHTKAKATIQEWLFPQEKPATEKKPTFDIPEDVLVNIDHIANNYSIAQIGEWKYDFFKTLSEKRVASPRQMDLIDKNIEEVYKIMTPAI